ncbi:MAG: TIGR00366 family protein [Pseudomonadota bacterium]
MLRALGSTISRGLQRWVPEPFVIAILLTLLSAAFAIIFTESSTTEVLEYWYSGFWLLLEFGMQMVLILVTGFAIALSPAVTRLIGKLALFARGPTAVYVTVVVIGGLLSLVSWSWIVLVAVLARELARRVEGLDYSYLVALVYLSILPWVGGLSSSIALLLNTDDNFLISAGILADKIGIAATLGAQLNWLYLAAYFIGMPLFLLALRPHPSQSRSMADMADSSQLEQMTIAEEAAKQRGDGNTPSDRMNDSVSLQLLIAIPILIYVLLHFYRNGFDLNLNIMIFLFIGVGMVVHHTPLRFTIAMKRACSNISGVIFQYPFYAGIMGIMMFSGLGIQLADAIAGNASMATLPFLAQVVGALANFAIPSAGGEWAVIGPPLTNAAISLSEGLSPNEQNAFIARIAMAAAYGETSTNLMQPFFLLLVMPIMGAGVRIQARDVMGYLVLPFLFTFFTTAMLVTFLPL